MLSKLLHKLPWQVKLVGLMIILAVLPSLLVSYGISNLLKNELISNTNTLLTTSTISVSESINSKVKKTKEIIELLTKTIENPSLSVEQKISFLTSNTEKIDNIISISILINENDGFKTAVSSTKDFIKKKDGKLLPINESISVIDDSLLTKNDIHSPIISIPKYNNKIHAWLSWILVEAKFPNMPKAIVAAQVDLTEISLEIENNKLNKIGNLLVIDGSGNKFLTSKFHVELPPQVVEDAAILMKQEKNISLIKNYDADYEDEFVASFAAPDEVKWLVVSYVKQKDAYAAVDDVVIFYIVFLGLTALLSTAVAILFSRHLSKPIIKMAETSQTIADGNFDVQIEYKANDSIGMLNNSLSKMGIQLKKNFQDIEEQKNQLEDYSKNLEQKVEQRTNELNESNIELKKAYKRVLELNEEKNEFLGIAAHDLKNPLTAVSAFAEILKEDKEISREQHDDFLDEIVKASSRMFFIVRNLLDVNAIEQGNLNTKFETISLQKINREMLAQFSSETSQKNITLYDVYETENVLVKADYNLMLQVVQNIISNAIKFSPPNKNIFITVKENKITDCIELRVKDEGPGFTEDDKKKLFKKFARLSARPTAGEHSTGLGLSIVKKLVEMMNGTIELESKQGQGAEFILSFQKADKE